RYPVSDNLFYRRNGRFEPVDPARRDATHPIRDLDVLDIFAKKPGGGALLALVIAAPLGGDARSALGLFRKLNGYVDYAQSEAFVKECGPPNAAMTAIEVHLHRDSDPQLFEILESVTSAIRERNIALSVVVV